MLCVVVSVDLEGAASAGAREFLDDLFVGCIELLVAGEEFATVQHDAVVVEFVV